MTHNRRIPMTAPSSKYTIRYKKCDVHRDNERAKRRAMSTTWSPSFHSSFFFLKFNRMLMFVNLWSPLIVRHNSLSPCSTPKANSGGFFFSSCRAQAISLQLR